ncbi:MFS family permease [Actinopolyspora biskrensis]|uniref:MFS family permease n=1 Tax=Actinopolyspora biskrensis TaxID=1470178 RepID=A0A852YTR2_9ACTN|nr:MFS family permease [Actinopolyspora biskrensis]
MRQGVDTGRAWVVLGGATLGLFVAFGIAYSYGAFFTPLATYFGVGPGLASVLFSITSLLFFCLGVVTGPLADRVGLRLVLSVGAVVLALGLVGASLAHTAWQAYLAYGFGVGLGVGCLYVPVVSAVGSWFARYRALATGVAVSGIGLGTVAGPPLTAWLVGQIGWRHAFQIWGVAGLVLLLVAIVLLAPAPESQRSATTKDPAVASRGFVRLYVSVLLINCALYVPFVHLAPSALRLGLSPVTAAALVSVIGAASIAGRLLLGVAASRYRTMTLFLACYACTVISLLIWASATGYPQLLIFTLVMGVGYGGYIALTPVILAEEFGPAALSRRLGIVYTAVGVGSAAGPAMTGFIVQSTHSYATAAYLLAAFSLAGFLILAPKSGPASRQLENSVSDGADAAVKKDS